MLSVDVKKLVDKFVKLISLITSKMGVTTFLLQVISIIPKLLNQFYPSFFCSKAYQVIDNLKKFDIAKSRRGKPLKLNI